jgi:peptidoglycan/xylan/chitin deacetylase (PgdA/CDA1 family)
MPQLSRGQMKDEIECCNNKIEAITGVKPTLLRPPYGDYDNALIETMNELKMYTIQWDVDSLDWKDNATPDSICKRVTSKVKNGSIVLFHNDADHTPAALPTILKCLKDEGYEFVFISDLIYKENYEIIHDGTQCKIKE